VLVQGERVALEVIATCPAGKLHTCWDAGSYNQQNVAVLIIDYIKQIITQNVDKYTTASCQTTSIIFLCNMTLVHIT